MKNYYRQFITLLQERPGFAMPGKEAAGRIVIEAKGGEGRAMVYIQDISPRHTYKLALISRRDGGNLGVVLGSILVGERGRYDGKFEFDGHDIGGSTMTCDQIDGVVVFVNDKDNKEPIGTLVGYKTVPFSWRIGLNFDSAPQVMDAKTLQTPYFAEEVPISVYNFTPPEPPLASIRKDDLASLFHSHTAVEVFIGDTSPVKWIAVSLYEVKDLGQTGAKIYDNHHVRIAYEEYRHILLGQANVDGQNTYILGIPDVYKTNIPPHEASPLKDFDTFKLCRPNNQKDGAPGYWLKILNLGIID